MAINSTQPLSVRITKFPDRSSYALARTEIMFNCPATFRHGVFWLALFPQGNLTGSQVALIPTPQLLLGRISERSDSCRRALLILDIGLNGLQAIRIRIHELPPK